MDAEVVHDDVVAFLELRTEHLADVGCKYLHVGRALDQERGAYPVVAQGRDEGRCRPMAMGNGPYAAPTTGAPASQAGHLGVERGLVDKDQAPRIPPGLLAAPERASGRYIRPVLLGGARRFFLNSAPSASAGARER